MKTKRLILVCNAHLDPVWLWEWGEGLAETLSTFGTAVKFCEEFDGFIFCHNESILYKWVEEFDAELFSKIQKLVQRNKWSIIGGWYLQPDCNMPCGESFIRQILLGKNYFLEKFNVAPKTAINFDSFGHTRGLVQILKKSGYNSYLFCRPDAKYLELPNDDFIWVGYDGSEIFAHRSDEHYNSKKGTARQKIENWMAENKIRQNGIVLWGIGNHGGGASRIDLEQISDLQKESDERKIVHGKPEDYFEWLEENKNSLPKFARDINPWAVGCYTSMALVKQKHRQLENSYFVTEKILASGSLRGLIEYPKEPLQLALEDLLFSEFHDILPGSSIPENERHALQRMDHGLEILDRLKTKAFVKFLSGHEPAKQDEFPLFVYNPHPYYVEEIIECEFQPPEPNFNENIIKLPRLIDSDGKTIFPQLEKERSNLQLDWRKRVVFKAKLKPTSMNRFFCYLDDSKISAQRVNRKENLKKFIFKTDSCEIKINRQTGLIDLYRVNNIDILKPQSCQLLIMKDNADTWAWKERSFRNLAGKFTLLSEKNCAKFVGIAAAELSPVRIIENGSVRTVVEALFTYNDSFACVKYKIPKQGSEVEIELRIFWLEKDRMLKLSFPSNFENSKCKGQVAYGVQEFDRIGEELVAQKWIAIFSTDQKNALTIINNCSYGFDFQNGEARLSLLRSPAYSALEEENNSPLLKQDRFESRIDQGERTFRFWINGGSAQERFEKVDREAQIKNEFPMALCCFPSGAGNKTEPAIALSDETVLLTSLKMAEKNNWLIIRLFEPIGVNRHTNVNIPSLKLNFSVALNKFEIKTIAIDIETRKYFEVDLLERKLDGC